jgi:hypothetical protein
MLDALLEELLEASEQVEAWYRDVDQAFERLKAEHNQRAGNPMGFTAHIPEMGRQAVASVPGDPTGVAYAVMDRAADHFLKSPPEDRKQLGDFFADCRGLERIHRGYVGARAVRHLRSSRDALWLWRGLAVAALAQGGTDFRDLHLALQDLWDAAESAGLDASLAFRQIGLLADAHAGRGGLRSIQEYLVQFRR